MRRKFSTGLTDGVSCELNRFKFTGILIDARRRHGTAAATSSACVCIARPRNAVMVALDQRGKMKRWALLMEHTVT